MCWLLWQHNLRHLAARPGLSVWVLLVVYVGLFHQQMKNFCENINTDSGKLSVSICGASLFFHTFCWTDKRMNICVPWRGPQFGNPPPLVAAYGSSSALACCCYCCCCYCCCSSSSTSLASARDSKSVSAEFHWWFPPWVLFFPSHCWTPIMVCLI